MRGVDSMKKPSKVSIRNYTWLFMGTIAGIVASDTLLRKQIIDSSKILHLGNEFQYNLLSFSGVIAGFLFTGVGILISAIGSERINRLWIHHYLDNLYYSAALGIISNIVNIIAVMAFIGCRLDENVKIKIINLEVICICLSLLYFTWSTVKLIRLISKMKNGD